MSNRRISVCLLVLLTAALLLPGCGVPDEGAAYAPKAPLPAAAPKDAPALMEAEAAPEADVPPFDEENRLWNVADFGAVGNGRADDYAAVQKAVNTVLRAGGGTLYFPNGSYRISETLRITMPGDAPLTLLADPASSVSLMAATDLEGPAVYVNHPYVTFSRVGITDNAAGESPALVLASDYALVDSCSFRMGSGNSASAVVVYGSHNTIRHMGMQWGSETVYAVEFTKKPGILAVGNVLTDSHFGGEHAKCVLVTTEDGDNRQEHLTIDRNVFLVVSCDQIEVRAVKDLFITDNMLDAAGVGLLMDPLPAGIDGVQMTNNYVGASTGGDRTGGIRTETTGGGSVTDVVVSANYFWAPEAVSFVSDRFTGFRVTDNYFVLTGGTAMTFADASGALIEGNIVVNLNSKSSLKIDKLDDKTVIQANQLGDGVSVPDWKTRFAGLN